MAELAGKHALVTGGGTGIGMGIARQLLKAGATVTISGRREDVLLDAKKHFEDNGLTRIQSGSQFVMSPLLIRFEPQLKKLLIQTGRSIFRLQMPE